MSKRPKCKTCDYTIPYHDGIDGYCFECVSRIIAASGDKFELLQAALQAMTLERDELTKQLMEHGEALTILAQLRVLYKCSPDMNEPQVKSATKHMMAISEEGLRLSMERRREEYIKKLQAQLDALRWIPVEQGLPEDTKRREVIVERKNNSGNTVRFVAIAEYVKKWSILGEDFLSDEYSEEFYESDYDKENDCYWTPSGWYEYNFGTEMNLYIGSATVTHHRPITLPEPNKKEKQNE